PQGAASAEEDVRLRSGSEWGDEPLFGGRLPPRDASLLAGRLPEDPPATPAGQLLAVGGEGQGIAAPEQRVLREWEGVEVVQSLPARAVPEVNVPPRIPRGHDPAVVRHGQAGDAPFALRPPVARVDAQLLTPDLPDPGGAVQPPRDHHPAVPREGQAGHRA